MKPSLLDTDIFSEIWKGINQSVGARSLGYLGQYDHHTISTVSVVELVRGFHRAGRGEEIERLLSLLSDFEVLSLNVHSAELTGRIQAGLQRTGQPIGWADPAIAAIALEHGLTLVTGNTAHFQRIQDLGYPLQLDNWRLP